MNKPLVTFVATAHFEEPWNTPFIDSIRSQKDPNWKTIIYHNGHNNSLRDRIGFLMDDRITYLESEADEGNWGTANRQRAIDICNTPWIVQTSIQDYWLPEAVGYINNAIEKNKAEIIYWNSINHVVGPCLVLDGQLAWSKCDWGQFALRTPIAQKVGIKRGDVYCGDWAFVSEVLSSGLIKQTVKINGVLTCHN